MSKQKILVPEDNYGRVYIGLLETKLSSAAKLVYGVMWSFGQDSWASLASISRRSSLSRPTVIKAQRELEGAGWITLVEVGSAHTTSTWRMNPPAVNELYTRGKATLPLEVKPLYWNKEGNQEEKQEISSAEAESNMPEALGTVRDPSEVESLAGGSSVEGKGLPGPKKGTVEESPEALKALGLECKKVRDYFHAEFEKVLGRKAAWTPAKWVLAAEQDLVRQLGTKECMRRIDNCLRDGYVQPPRYIYFLRNPESFYELRVRRVQGPKGEFESKRGKLPPVPKGIIGIPEDFKLKF